VVGRLGQTYLAVRQTVQKSAPYQVAKTKLLQLKTQITESQNPTVQRALDWGEDTVQFLARTGSKISGSTSDRARTLKLIRELDPSFTIRSFTHKMRHSLVPSLYQALLQGDHNLLKAVMTERWAEHEIEEATKREKGGMRVVPQLMNIEDVELMDARLVDDRPTLLVRISSQQHVDRLDKRTGRRYSGSDGGTREISELWTMQLNSAGEWVVAHRHIFRERISSW
jgi:predicted lipid-binding transport protein (Tim44 family)